MITLTIIETRKETTECIYTYFIQVFYKVLVHTGPAKWPSSLLRLPIYIGLISQNITKIHTQKLWRLPLATYLLT